MVDITSADEHPGDIKVVAIIFIVLSWVAVGLRCYVRVFITKLFRVDDWLAVATSIVFTIYATFVLLGESSGTGRHFSHLSSEDHRNGMMWWYCGELTYVITTCLLKVTIGVFLMQICIKKSQIYIIRAVMIIFTIFTAFFFFLMAFQCHPVSYFWTENSQPSSNGEGCLDAIHVRNSAYAHGALSAAVDWILGILPIFLVWNLNMNLRTKISVALILALGAVGSTATVIRMQYIGAIGAQTDFLFANTGVSIWSTVEPGMGITASSMACLRPLFQAFLSRSGFMGSSNPGAAAAWNPQRMGYVRDRNSNGPEAFRLQGNFAKSSRGNPFPAEDVEVGAGADLAAPERHGSTHTINEVQSWDMVKRSMTDESSDENRRFHTSEGATVVHAER